MYNLFRPLGEDKREIKSFQTVDSFTPYAFGYRTYSLALFIVMSLSYIRLLTTFFGDHHHQDIIPKKKSNVVISYL